MTAVSLPAHRERKQKQNRTLTYIARTVDRLSEGVVTSVLVVAVACLMISAMPGFFGFGTVRVMGASMGQAIPVGSIAVLGRVKAADTRVGDVILFAGKEAEVPVMHRVVSIDRSNGHVVAITRGDANNTPDPSPRELKGSGGKVVASVPLAGFVLTAVRIKLIWVLIVIAMVRRIAKAPDPAR